MSQIKAIYCPHCINVISIVRDCVKLRKIKLSFNIVVSTTIWSNSFFVEVDFY